jgi:hypothetical protein
MYTNDVDFIQSKFFPMEAKRKTADMLVMLMQDIGILLEHHCDETKELTQRK